MLLKSQEYMQQVATFLRLASQESVPMHKRQLLRRARHAKGMAKLARMVELRGSAKPIR